jgi:hypothetical protein
MWVVLPKRKDQALQVFRIMKMVAEVEAKAKLKALCTDRGGEFTSNEFVEINCLALSISLEFWFNWLVHAIQYSIRAGGPRIKS